MTSDEDPPDVAAEPGGRRASGSEDPTNASLSLPSPDLTTDLTYHPGTDTYRTEYDREATPPARVVVHAIAALEDRSPLELDPINTALDPDALDSLFASRGICPDRGDVTVAFDYHGYGVTIHSYGVIAVRSRR